MLNRASAARTSIASLFSVALVACAGVHTHMKPHYAKSVVQPVEIEKIAGDQIRIRYNMPRETMYYSPGLNYESADGTLKLFIDRCHIKDKCKPMASAPLSPSTGWQVAAQVPYQGERVVMVYTDSEEQVYP